MEGFGFNKDLPSDLKDRAENIWIFNGNHVEDGNASGGLGLWQPLKPGNGTGFKSDGKTFEFSSRFGPEQSFGHKMATLSGEPVAIIKYARGGSALANGYGWGDWWVEDEGLNQFDFFLRCVDSAFANSDINGDGINDILIPAGIIWMQGESDAEHEVTAHAYKENLKNLMQAMREVFDNPELPIVLGKIADSGMDPEDGKMMNYLEVVQQAQLDFTDEDCCALLVNNTTHFNFLPDKWHYKSDNYIELGEAFAEAAFSFQTKQ